MSFIDFWLHYLYLWFLIIILFFLSFVFLLSFLLSLVYATDQTELIRNNGIITFLFEVLMNRKNYMNLLSNSLIAGLWK